MQELGKTWAWAAGAASAMAAALAMGCSSNKTASGDGGGATDGAASSEDGGSGVGDGGPADDTATMTPPCDAAIQLPTDGAAAAACSQCLMANCASALTTCSMDCVCVSGVECLAANDDNATICTSAESALGAGNVGLMDVSGCLAMNCDKICHGILDAGAQ